MWPSKTPSIASSRGVRRCSDTNSLAVRVSGVKALSYLAKRHLDRYGWDVLSILDDFSLQRYSARQRDEDLRMGVHTSHGGYEGPWDGGVAYSEVEELRVLLAKRRKRQRLRQKLRRWNRRR